MNTQHLAYSILNRPSLRSTAVRHIAPGGGGHAAMRPSKLTRRCKGARAKTATIPFDDVVMVTWMASFGCIIVAKCDIANVL